MAGSGVRVTQASYGAIESDRREIDRTGGPLSVLNWLRVAGIPCALGKWRPYVTPLMPGATRPQCASSPRSHAPGD